MKFVSFDLFDTCFVRKCGTPREVYRLLAKQILGEQALDSNYVDFIQIRVNAEKQARLYSKNEEVTIHDIYNECDFSSLTDYPRYEILQAELQWERSMLVVVSEIKELINTYRVAGRKILFISDMYLSYDFLYELMVSSGLMRDNDELFVSSEIGLTKSSGNLYRYIHSKLKINYKEWIHYGDNSHSDIIVPRKLGIKSKRITHTGTKIEKTWLKVSGYKQLNIVTRLAGLAKSMRLSKNNQVEDELIYDLIIPLYTAFVITVFKEAIQNKISDLYFLSRDGRLLYQIAKKISDHYPGIQIHYLYTSRKALYLPSITNFSKTELRKLLNPIIGKTWKQLFDRLDYNIETVLPLDICEQVIRSEDYFFQILERNPQIEKQILNKSLQAKEQVIRYFQQEGLFDLDKRSALIDIRGSRSCHEAINKILISKGHNPIFGFYFEVVKDRIFEKDSMSYFSLMYDDENEENTSYKPLNGLYDVFEQIFSINPTLRTIGYQDSKDNKNIEPIFEDEVFSQKCILFANKLYESVNQYIDEMRNIQILDELYLILDSSLMRGLIDFASYPEKRFLTFLADFRTSDSSYDIRPLIRKLTLKEIFQLYYLHQTIINVPGWLRGSVIWSYPTLFALIMRWKNYKND